MNRLHTTPLRRWFIPTIALVALVSWLVFSNGASPWASAKTKAAQQPRIQPPIFNGQPSKPDRDKDKDKNEEQEEADLPPFARGKIEKGEYMDARDSYIRMLRGLPYPEGPNPRVAAIREAQKSEPNRPQALTAAWTAIGPAPIPNGQTSPVVPVSGRVTAIDVHPTNPNIVYVGTAQGGVYRTLDGGLTWTPLMDSALSLAIGAVTISPSSPSTVFVGTGEGNLSADSFFGVGVYVIQNADGAAPTLVGPLNKDASNADVMTGRSISKVLVHPTDPNTIFVATTTGTASNPSSATGAPAPVLGLYRSTNALGAAPTFARLNVPPSPTGSRRIQDAVLEPGTPNNLICTVFGTNAANDGGIWRTTNALAAVPTFTRTLTLGSATNGSHTSLAINKVGSTVTVIASNDAGNGALRRSVDGGVTWSAAIGGGSAGFCGGQCFYDRIVSIHPNDANIIMIGGATIFRRATNGATFVNGGASLHADHHALVHAPSNPSIVYEGNDGGIYKSTDTGATWTSLNNTGFSATQFEAIAVHPRDRNFTLGGTQDNGTNFYQPDATWTRADFGDGGYALIDQNAYDNTNVTAYHTYFNQQNSILGFGRVTNMANAQDNGWSFLGFGGTPNGIGNDPVQFYAPMTLGPGNPNTLYYGSNRLYRSSNQGTTMTVVSQAPIVAGFLINTISVAAQDDLVRMVGLNNGSVWATATGSSTLTNVTSVSFPVRSIGRVAIDPNNKSTAYATFLGFGVAAGAHVWKTTNLNAAVPTWTAAGTGIPDVPVDSFVIDPQNGNNLFAGTDIGVFASTDGGATWASFGTGLPRVAVFDLAIQNNNRVLRAATHGRGIFEITIPGTVTPLATLTQGTVTTTPLIDNGNGVLDPSEDGILTIPLNNVGNATATGVTATLTTTTPGVTILNGTSTYPNIAALATQSNTTPYLIRLAANFVCGAPIKFVLTVTYNDPASPRTFPFSVPTGTPGVTPTTFTYAGAPVPIPDADLITGAVVPLNVSGLTGAISGIKFKLGGTSCNTTPGSTTVGIDHTFVGDLAIVLVSPSGTQIQLTPIGGNAGVNFCQTVFDDGAATAFASATAAQAPFTGSFRPLQPLSTYIGENGNGQWLIAVFDGGAVDTGSLRAFSLEFTTAVCAKANSSTTVISSLPVSNTGQAVTFTATVMPSGPVTGTVQFKDNGAPIGGPVVLALTQGNQRAFNPTTTGNSAVLLVNGVASITTSALTPGTHVVTAEYSGDANFNPSVGTVTQVVAPFGGQLADPLSCSGPGSVFNVTATVTNATAATQAIVFTAAPSVAGQLFVVNGSCTATGQASGSCSTPSTAQVAFSGNLAAGQTLTIRYQVQAADGLPPGTSVCTTSMATINGSAPLTVIACGTLNCPAAGPGALPGALNQASDQKPGSVLVYPVYTSDAANGAAQNARLAITNTHPSRGAFIHLFFVDGSSCSVADSFICLTPNQTAAVLASDIDPGTTGYVVAVATDRNGCPINFNYLIGDEYVKFATGHQANLTAEAIAALAGGLTACDTSTAASVQLNFDGVSYNQLPRVLAASNLPSRADGNDTLLIVNRLGGSLQTNASTLGTLFGLLYDDSEKTYSFSLPAATCQSRGSLTNDRPRVVPRYDQVIGAGRTGWLKIYGGPDVGIFGAQINRNANAASSAGAFNQGHNLHKLTLTTTASVTIPIFPPSC